MSKKLVRDNIPNLISESGGSFPTEVISGDELLSWLEDKIVEEAQELHEATGDESRLEELADLMEVVEAYRRAKGWSNDDVAAARDRKNAQKGAFQKGYVTDFGGHE